MNRICLFVFTLATLTFTAGTGWAGDNIIDLAEDAQETINEFGNSQCGSAVKGCWKTVKGTVKDTRKACKKFRSCKNKCRVAKRSDKQQCIASRCSSLSGKSKRQCKRSCRKGSRMLKRSCARKCKRSAACKSAWVAVAKGIGQCGKQIKDSDCGSWARKLGSTVRKLK